MCGAVIQQDTLFSTVIPEQRVPADDPLRPIREMINTVWMELEEGFNALYWDLGRDHWAARLSNLSSPFIRHQQVHSWRAHHLPEIMALWH